MTHTIQKPSFELNALEPYFDSATMDVHINKHHQGYADKLNVALTDHPELENNTLEELVSLGTKHQPLITNMAGGVLNHNFFWSILSPNVDQAVPDPLLTAINDTFGSKQDFIDQFTNSATSLFGSGWTWLVYTPGTNHQALSIINTPNQDNPLAQNKTPLLAIDLWEHAYYLKYQNRRPEYIDAFWHIINWEHVNQLYQSLGTRH